MAVHFLTFFLHKINFTISQKLYCVIIPWLKINIVVNQVILLCVVGSHRKFIPQIFIEDNTVTSQVGQGSELDQSPLNCCGQLDTVAVSSVCPKHQWKFILSFDDGDALSHWLSRQVYFLMLIPTQPIQFRKTAMYSCIYSIIVSYTIRVNQPQY